jgi:hypothetical protein
MIAIETVDDVEFFDIMPKNPTTSTKASCSFGRRLFC